MRLKNIIGMSAMALAFMTQSCQDYLNVKPYSQIAAGDFYQTEQQVDLALNGIYSTIGSERLYGSNLSCYFPVGTDAAVYSRTYNAWEVALHTVNETNVDIERTFRKLYEGINLCNLLITNIEPVKGINDIKKKRMIGEARFLRAYFYFDLVRWFKNVPMRLAPIKDGSSANTAQELSDALDIYKTVIIPDLEYAAANCTTKGGSGYEIGRVTQSASHALLQRVYLAIAGVTHNDERAKFPDFATATCYQKVVDQGNEVFKLGNYSLMADYTDIFRNEIKGTPNDQEVMFEVMFNNLRSSGKNEHGRIGNLNGVQCSMTGIKDPYAYAYAYAGLTLVKDYETSTGDANDDKRYVWNVAPYNVGRVNVLDTTYVDDPKTGESVRVVKESDNFVEGFKYVGNRYTRNPGKFRRVSFDEIESGVFRMERRQALKSDGKKKITLYSGYKQLPIDTYKIGNDVDGDYPYMLVNGVEKRLSKDYYITKEGRVWKLLDNGGLKLKIMENGSIDKNFTGINFPLIRYSDVLLMQAEAYNELNNYDQARLFIDQVKNRAGLPNLDPSQFNDRDKIFNELVSERSRELCFEGQRRHDLTRWGNMKDKLDELMQDLKEEPISKSQTWMLRSSENFDPKKHTYLPIPLKELNLNIGIKKTE
ncbi:RagB/SusD family nutrient uptake outer membrane protein [Halosquirtibacter xylanolyticus]|uniref:RagB/SusD family nutrient uptake outer membrane protein n=1 Tax=Halosquirtibacter xylanolyticus TaxID=3374599 RepID=UPI003749067E|nr:RagB/SusD family nutrient uptake outer membrane protein [Prolixibacteraceae bacterium]